MEESKDKPISHCVYLYKSEWTGKIKLVHNTKELFKAEKMYNGLNFKFNLDKKNKAEIYYQKKKHFLKINGVDFEHLYSKSEKNMKGYHNSESHSNK